MKKDEQLDRCKTQFDKITLLYDFFLIPKFPKATPSKAGLEKNCLNPI